MTGRQCLESILRHETPPRLCWTTLVDSLTRSVMPEPVRSLPVLDFYRHIGCDILQFGNYGLPADQQVVSPARRVEPPHEVETATQPDGTEVTTVRTAWGELTSCTRRSHPLKHPVETRADLQVARRMWEGTRYEEETVGAVTDRDAVGVGDRSHASRESFTRAEAALGDQGVYIPTLAPSPVQQLLELDMGLVAFYGLWQDYPREVEALLDAMQQARLQEWEIVARCSPARALIPVENTSSTMISPALYRRYSLPQLRAVVDVCHAHGKLVIFHMCGHLRDLLPIIRETGLDGAHATTPPPHGDTTLEQALDVCGEDFILMGGVFDGSIFQASEVTAEQMHRALDALYTPRLRKAKLLLGLGADGLPTPLERFLAVGEWFAANGSPAPSGGAAG
ncbi:hypothetical protein LLH23_05915 [bacterium]|nr:hypothetical protein [bacterium]